MDKASTGRNRKQNRRLSQAAVSTLGGLSSAGISGGGNQAEAPPKTRNEGLRHEQGSTRAHALGNTATEEALASTDIRRREVLLKAEALQSAIFNSANFSSSATDARGPRRVFSPRAQHRLGQGATEAPDTIAPTDSFDQPTACWLPQEPPAPVSPRNGDRYLFNAKDAEAVRDGCRE